MVTSTSRNNPNPEQPVQSSSQSVQTYMRDSNTNSLVDCLRITLDASGRWGKVLSVANSPRSSREENSGALVSLDTNICGADPHATLRHITRRLVPALYDYRPDLSDRKIRITVVAPDAPIVKKQESLNSRELTQNIKSKLLELGIKDTQIILARVRLSDFDYHLAIVSAPFKTAHRLALIDFRQEIFNKFQVRLRFESLPGSTWSKQFDNESVTRVTVTPRVRVKSPDFKFTAQSSTVLNWASEKFISYDSGQTKAPEDMSFVIKCSDDSYQLKHCTPLEVKRKTSYRSNCPTLSLGLEAIVAQDGTIAAFKFSPVNASLTMPVDHYVVHSIEGSSEEISGRAARSISRASELEIDLKEQLALRRNLDQLLVKRDLQLGKVVLDLVDTQSSKGPMYKSEHLVTRNVLLQRELFARWMHKEGVPILIRRPELNVDSLAAEFKQQLPNFAPEDLLTIVGRTKIVSTLAKSGHRDLLNKIARCILDSSRHFELKVLDRDSQLYADDMALAKLDHSRNSNLAVINQYQFCAHALGIEPLCASVVEKLAMALVTRYSNLKGSQKSLLEEFHVHRARLAEEFNMIPDFVGSRWVSRDRPRFN